MRTERAAALLPRDSALSAAVSSTPCFRGRFAAFCATARRAPSRCNSTADLAWVPWELAFDGESFIGEKFRICRQIVADEQTPKLHRPTPKRGALKVLVLAGGTPRAESEAAAQSLIARLRIIEGVAVSGANTLDLRRDDLLNLIGTSDIVHYVGPVDGSFTLVGSVSWWHEAEPLDVRSIASLPAPPQLLISQNTTMPRLAGQPRANQALGCERVHAWPQHPDLRVGARRQRLP